MCLAGPQLRTQHPLRERAKKLDQGILVIRFEMPFNVFCACGKLIGKVRTCFCFPPSVQHQRSAPLSSRHRCQAQRPSEVPHSCSVQGVGC